MYTSFQLTKKYISYYLGASNSKGHGIHSPFVFNFILDVLNNRQQYLPPSNIEGIRKQLQHNTEALTIKDLGAGSRRGKSEKRTIAQLAKTAVKPKKYGHLFYRLVKKYQPQNIIELGTSLGVTTAYIATAAPASNIITIEGSEAIRQAAQSVFKRLDLTNIQSECGNFDEVLPLILSNLSVIDFAYVDGNHRYAPTMNYFLQLLEKSNNNTILLFDDIHWSSEMERAWKAVQQHKAVRCTIDLFFIGFVFFKQEFKEAQHFTIRF
jgi:predicted O-methyltransferase YrrM